MSNSAKAQKTSLFANSHDFISVVKEVSLIVNKLSGIQLGEKQFAMVENRVKSRMVRLGLSSAPDYLQYLKTHLEQESMALLSLITTHHTYFFREFTHFDFLIREGLKNIIDGVRARGDRKLRVWSSACSRGQEVYTLAMFLSAHLPQMAPEIDFEIYEQEIATS
jgi:chemotaxis protein methyltransferase CheR